jgi:18S rRNA (guanine1575-N7)-methyltransferase
MSERAIELLCLEDENPSLVLDVGCGSGISGDVTFLIFLKKKGFI